MLGMSWGYKMNVKIRPPQIIFENKTVEMPTCVFAKVKTFTTNLWFQGKHNYENIHDSCDI